MIESDEVSTSSGTNELPSSQVRTSQSMQVNLPKYNHNDNEIK